MYTSSFVREEGDVRHYGYLGGRSLSARVVVGAARSHRRTWKFRKGRDGCDTRATDGAAATAHHSMRAMTEPPETPAHVSSTPMARTWRDSEQRDIARRAAKGKCRRKAVKCVFCFLFFAAVVVSVLVLSVALTYNDGRNDRANATSGSDSSNITREHTSPEDGLRRAHGLRSNMKQIVVTSACGLGALLLAGHALRRYSRWLRALHLPSSVIGGLIGWCFFAAVEAVGAGELADAWFSDGWNVLPGFCTNIIFSALFLGTPVPRPGAILASPRREHFIYGLIVVFGQYVVSCICTLICQIGDNTLDAPFATVMPYGYAGGPVVAEAMKDLYAEDSFNYPDGYTLALLAATVGMFAGVIAGALLVNFAPLSADRSVHGGGNAAGGGSSAGEGDAEALPESPPGIIMASTVDTRGGGLIKRVKRKAFKIRDAFVKLKETANQSDHFPVEERPSAGEQTVSVESLDSLIFHASLVTLVMLAGYVMRTPYAACANGISQHTRITAPFLHSH